MTKEILIFVGLSLDAFIVMMNKGAQLKDLNIKKIALYALQFAAIATFMFMFGFGVSKLISIPIERGTIEVTIAALIIFFVGVLTLTKSFMQKNFVEKLDENFDCKTLCKMAVYTSIDTFFMGGAYGFLSVETTHALAVSFVTTFLAVSLALGIGYNLGAKYQRIVGMVGGALMVFFGIYLIAFYLILR